MQNFHDAVGGIGTSKDECAMSEVHDARGLVDDHDTQRCEGVDGPELQATDDDHCELANHFSTSLANQTLCSVHALALRRIRDTGCIMRQDAEPTTFQLPLMMRALATFLFPW